MACISLVGPFHPASNPRLVRDADALAQAGHDVSVIMPRFDPRWALLEDSVVARAAWRYRPVDFLRTPGARLRWHVARIQRRLCRELTRRWLLPWAAWRSLSYGFPALLRELNTIRADLIIAHTHSALPIAGLAAARQQTALAFDAEDLLAECSAEPQTTHDLIERRFLPHCGYVSTMCCAAAEFLRQKHSLSELPLVLHNSSRLSERAGVLAPEKRPPVACRSVYWFGQTIGPQSRADQVLRAMPLVSQRFRLVLRGNPLPNYVQRLHTLSVELGCEDRLEIVPVEPPSRLVALAAEHDILLGSQPGQTPFNQNAIGNKVLTGILAGLAVLFTDTTAHRRLLHDYPGLGICFADQDEQDLARALNTLLSDPSLLLRTKLRCWEVGSQHLNWDTESQTLIARVEQVLSSRDSRQRSGNPGMSGVCEPTHR